MTGWYLSFDCGTKAFAFALIEAGDPAAATAAATTATAAAAAVARLDPGARDPDALKSAAATVAEASRATRGLFRLAGGGAADLAPGRPGASLSTVERVRAVVAYLRGPVAGALAAAGAPTDSHLKVAVEYQLGMNPAARAVAVAIVAHYAAQHPDAGVFFVGPSLKNRIAPPAGYAGLAYGDFAERYRSAYTANKQHATALYFRCIAPLFEHDPAVLEKIPKDARKDFADAVLQVLGFILYGGDPAVAHLRF